MDRPCHPGGPDAAGAAVPELLAEIRRRCRQPWTLMEVCGGQTHALLRSGLDQCLPPSLSLIHGPGCPVCVTPAATIDAALALARRPEVILCSYGDMMRVPGSPPSRGADAAAPPIDLLSLRAAGADVRLVTAPLQALELARRHPQRQVVFLAVGFETTAPATALLARQALRLEVANLSLLCAHVRVVPAMEAILAAPGNRIQGFLAAGHVAAVTGTAELEALVARWHLPVVVTGFTPLQLARGVLQVVDQLESGTAELRNAYEPVVTPAGNRAAQQLIAEVFAPATVDWRGLGPIPAGGLVLRGAHAALDAQGRFPGWTGRPPGADGVAEPGVRQHQSAAGPRTVATDHRPAAAVGMSRRASADPSGAPFDAAGSVGCLAAAVLTGRIRPPDCPCFGTCCTPERPLGAPMVSSEGACAAYWWYRR